MAAWHAWARAHAPDAPAGYFEESFGLRNDAIIGRLMPGIAADALERLADEKEQLFRASAAGGLTALPGVAGLLHALTEHGIPKAIVTSTPRVNLEFVLGELGLAGRFEALVSAEDVVRGKPAPDGFLAGAARVGVAPADCVVIEDAPAGLAAAKAGGMRAIGVTTTHPAAALFDAGLVVDSLADERVMGFIARGSTA